MKEKQLQEILRKAFDTLKSAENVEERIEAASNIWNISISNPEELFDSIDTLGDFLLDHEASVRGLIAWTLYTLSIKNSHLLLPLLDEIGHALLDMDLSVRRYIANILVEVSKEFPEHVDVLTPTLIKASEDPSIDVRVAVEKIQQNILAEKKRSTPTKSEKIRQPPVLKETVSEISVPRGIIDEISISQRITVLEDKVYYRLSMFNESLSDVSNVVAVIVNCPLSLQARQPLMQQRMRVFSKTMADFEFIFKSMEDFLEGIINSTISFIDKQCIIHTISNKPFSVQFAYKFLRKLEKPLEFYEQYMVANEHSRPTELRVQQFNMVGDDVFLRVKKVLDALNIQVIHEESEIISDIFSGIIKGLSRSIIHRQVYATQLNIIGPLTHQNSTKYFALKFATAGPNEKMRSLINSDIRNEIKNYMQLVDIEPSETTQQTAVGELTEAKAYWTNANLESKTCINCGIVLPKNAKYCNECGELQYRSFNK